MSSGTKTPLLIDHNDLIARRLHHLQPMNGFNPREIEENMLEKMSFLNKLQMQRPSAKAAQARAARLQELLHYCTNATLTQAGRDHVYSKSQYVYIIINEMRIQSRETTKTYNAYDLYVLI